jgi:hypothetical protein
MWVNSLGQVASLDPGVRMTIASVIAVEIALGAMLLRGRALTTRRDVPERVTGPVVHDADCEPKAVIR